MLPQHGGVPNFRLRVQGSVVALLLFVLLTGGLLTLSLHSQTDPGDLAAQNRVKLSAIVTGMVSFFIILTATGRWWHPHLWKHGNSQLQHRHRRKHANTKHSKQ